MGVAGVREAAFAAAFCVETIAEPWTEFAADAEADAEAEAMALVSG